MHNFIEIKITISVTPSNIENHIISAVILQTYLVWLRQCDHGCTEATKGSSVVVIYIGSVYDPERPERVRLSASRDRGLLSYVLNKTRFTRRFYDKIAKIFVHGNLVTLLWASLYFYREIKFECSYRKLQLCTDILSINNFHRPVRRVQASQVYTPYSPSLVRGLLYRWITL